MTLPGDHPAPDYSARTLRDLAAAAGGRGGSAPDERAFEALHKRLTPGLKKILLERANQRHEVVEDITQKTWLAVWRALREGRYDESRSAITTFVYAVGYKVWLQHLRREGRSIATASGGESALDQLIFTDETGSGPGGTAAAAEAGLDPASAAPLAELIDAVRESLQHPDSGLTDDERRLVREAASGASDRDLARELGLAASTINARRRAALEKIRRFLAQRGHRGFPGEREGERRQ